MKLKSILFLIVFVGFLITPAIITYIKKDTNIAMFYSLNEEEKTSTPKVDTEKTQSLYHLNIPNSLSDYSKNSGLNFHSIGEWNNIYFETVSPPPEFSVLIG